MWESSQDAEKEVHSYLEMAGEGFGADVPLSVIREIERVSGAGTFSGLFKKECAGLARRISLLSDFIEEIRDFERIQRNGDVDLTSSYPYCFADLTTVLQEAKILLLAANNFYISENSSVEEHNRIFNSFCSVTSKFEESLASFPFHKLNLSDEAQEQVELVRTQLKRAARKYGQRDLTERAFESLCFENKGKLDCEVRKKGSEKCTSHSSTSNKITPCMNSDNVIARNSAGECIPNAKQIISDQSVVLPIDFLCPISLELMRDPVIVSTGQTYERSCIQRWIDCGNKTCPKTQQKLSHLALTPNYLLSSLISQWCSANNIRQSKTLINGHIRRSDGSFHDVTNAFAAIRDLVRKLTCQNSIEEVRNAVAEIRLLSKKSTENRILLAEAEAIPILVNILVSPDAETRDHAITTIFNLSLHGNNRRLIVLADAIPLIVQVLRTGSMEAKENAAATLFCLSKNDENKITIGASNAIKPLVELLSNGSSKGKRDAATALFSLCIYSPNKSRAIRDGIITPLMNLITDSATNLGDESLTIIALLCIDREAKVKMVEAKMIPVLIDILKGTGSCHKKECACYILLYLCKNDKKNIDSMNELGALVPLTELCVNGTVKAMRKSVLLVELLLEQ